MWLGSLFVGLFAHTNNLHKTDRQRRTDETEDHVSVRQKSHVIRRGSVSVRGVAGCPACLTLQMMGSEGKADLPA